MTSSSSFDPVMVLQPSHLTNQDQSMVAWLYTHKLLITDMRFSTREGKREEKEEQTNMPINVQKTTVVKRSDKLMYNLGARRCTSVLMPGLSIGSPGSE